MKKIISFICIIVCTFTLGGCYNYTEINNITFATSVLFDRDDFGNIVLYIDCVRPYRNANESSDKGKRIIFKGNGKTALEAIRDINVKSSNKLNFSQVRAYIFTEELARKGIKDYIDLINNDQQFSYKPYMFVYSGDVKSLIDFTNEDDEYLGLYLNQLVENNKANGKIIKSNVNDYITSTLTKGKIAFMSEIELKDTGVGEKIQLSGGIIMKDNIMVDEMQEKDVLTYNILQHKVKEGTFEIPNPKENDKLITLDILEETNKTDIFINDDVINLNKNINIKVSIGEMQGSLSIDQDILSEIKGAEEWKIKKYEEEFFNRYKEKNIDVLKIERLLEEHYPHYDTEGFLDKAVLKTKVNIIIDGSSLVKDSI